VPPLFLLVQGYSFWLFVALLAGRDAPHGAVMQYFFGGTFLYWLFVMFLVSVITMRLVAEERRAGTLEQLLTAPVDEAQVVVGKYLGALVFWAALWTRHLLYAVGAGELRAACARPGTDRGRLPRHPARRRELARDRDLVLHAHAQSCFVARMACW